MVSHHHKAQSVCITGLGCGDDVQVCLMLWKVMAHSPVVGFTRVGSSRDGVAITVTRRFAGLYEYDGLSTVQQRSGTNKGESLIDYLV